MNTITNIIIQTPVDLEFKMFWNKLDDNQKIWVITQCMEWTTKNMNLFFPEKEGK